MEQMDVNMVLTWYLISDNEPRPWEEDGERDGRGRVQVTFVWSPPEDLVKFSKSEHEKSEFFLNKLEKIQKMFVSVCACLLQPATCSLTQFFKGSW
jgi:hypothetical protein